MEITELAEQNIWWKGKEEIERDYDILKWKEKKHRWIPSLIERISAEPFALHTILGPRQAGKTTTAKLFIKKLLERQDPKAIFYFNCEELADYKELIEVVNSYLSFKETNGLAISFILLDEVTAPKEWYRGIKSLVDKGKLKDDVVILTGSTSMVLKREVELFPGRRGKGKDFILLPLSFREFLKVVNPKLSKKIKTARGLRDLGATAVNASIYMKELNKILDEYMMYGGFPLAIESIGGDKEAAKKAHLSWIKTAVLKADRSDVIARQIIKALLERFPTPVSWEGISKEIEIKSPKTVAAYVELLKSIFAIHVIYNIDISSKNIKFGKNKKIHASDPLLLEVFEDWTFSNAMNRESVLAESILVDHLSRLFPERVFFWKNRFEIDALVLEKNRLHGFEVKWAEKPKAKGLPQLKTFTLITKKDFSRKPFKVPLSVFLAVLDV